MSRKVILTAVFGLVAAGFAWYGLAHTHSAPVAASQCLQKYDEAAKDGLEKATESAKDGLEKEDDLGGGLVF